MHLAQVGEDGENAAVAVLALGDVELQQDVAHVCLHRALAEHQALPDRGVGQTLGHQLEHASLAVGKPRELAPGCRVHQLGDDRRVECGPACGDAAGGLEELLDLQYPVLQQVAEPGTADQVDRVGGLDVLGEDENATSG